MKKKYTIRKKKKTISTMYIFIILLIILISISVGYSFFSSELNIVAKVILNKVVADDDYTELPSQLSNSELIVHVGAMWQQEDCYIYNMNLKLINLDNDVEEWIVTVDLPAYVSVEKTDFWCAAHVEIIQLENGSRLVFTNYDWNGTKPINSEIDFGFNLAFTEQVKINVENVTFNRRLIHKIEYTGDMNLYSTKVTNNMNTDNI